jgi:hypothetical protein
MADGYLPAYIQEIQFLEELKIHAHRKLSKLSVKKISCDCSEYGGRKPTIGSSSRIANA